MSNIKQLLEVNEVNELNNPASVRRNIRNGAFTGQTAGMAPGYTQGNLVILPENQAMDFMRSCQKIQNLAH